MRLFDWISNRLKWNLKSPAESFPKYTPEEKARTAEFQRFKTAVNTWIENPSEESALICVEKGAVVGASEEKVREFLRLHKNP